MVNRKTTGKQAVRRPVLAAKKSNPLPLVLGIGGGVVVLIIIIAVAAGGGGKPVRRGTEEAASKGPDVALPDYKRYENDGRQKLEGATRSVREKTARLAALPLEQRTGALDELRGDLKNKTEGIAALDTANQLIDKYNRESGKSIKRVDVDGLKGEWEKATGKLVRDLEREAQASADQGLAIVQEQGPKWKLSLPPDQHKKMKEETKRGMELLKLGLNCYEWCCEIAGTRYEVKKYIEAKKSADQEYKAMK